MAKIALAAGGTAGHLFPAAALAHELQAKGHEVHLLTDQRGLSYPHGFDGVARTAIASGSIVGKGLAVKIRSIAALMRGIWQAWRILKQLRVDSLVGFGGYPCVPPMIAAWMLGIPSMLHEQMRLWAWPIARSAALPSILPYPLPKPSAKATQKAIYTGNPVRADIAAIDPKTKATKALNLLVFAGSQGARIMADMVPAAVGALPADLRARLHLTLQIRAEDINRTQETLGID